MAPNFQEYILESKAIEYFEERLSDGLTLSRYLKKSTDLKTGQAITFAPDNQTKDFLLKFNSPFLKEPIPASGVQEINNKLPTDWLIKQIKSFLSQSKDNYCIFEDAEEYPAKNIISRFPFRNVLFKDNELYYILDHNDSDDTILEAVKQNSCFYIQGMGIFTTIKNISSHFSDKDHIKNEDFFEIAAKNTKKIYIQAYDHDGYILWKKNI